MHETSLEMRARRALERQLDYQRRKAGAIWGNEAEIIAKMVEHSASVRRELEAVQPLPADSKVLEVGSGAHGLIFYFEAKERVGVDPLAEEYRALFPAWQQRARTIAAFGERLPFEDASFDVVLCDNVVDHAECPRRIVEEIARVLVPGGLLYFTVNVHHPLYHWASQAHAAWRSVGIPVEIAPFADHTVHLTLGAAHDLFGGLPMNIVVESDTVDQTRREGRTFRARHNGDRLKRWFFKNARLEIIAAKTGVIGRPRPLSFP